MSVCRNLGSALQQKRDFLIRELTALGFKVLPNHGTYFLMTDFRPLLPPGSTETDVDFATRLTKEGGVTTIPVSLVKLAGPSPVTSACWPTPFACSHMLELVKRPCSVHTQAWLC